MGHYMDDVEDVKYERCHEWHRGVHCEMEPNHAGYHMGVSKKGRRHVWPQTSALKVKQRVVLRGGSTGYAVVQWVGIDRGGSAVALIRWAEGGHLALCEERRLRRLNRGESV